jgi:hypothetical protein
MGAYICVNILNICLVNEVNVFVSFEHRRLTLGSISGNAALRLSSTFARCVRYFDLMFVNTKCWFTKIRCVLQMAREHKLPVLPQLDACFWLLIRSHIYLCSKIKTEEFYHLTVQLTLLQESVRGVVFSLMVSLKGCLIQSCFFDIPYRWKMFLILSYQGG